VIVGRGGQAVLQGLPGALHVLVQASMPARILRIQQLEDVGMEQAYHSALDHDRSHSPLSGPGLRGALG
jgi:hypothetical protein